MNYSNYSDTMHSANEVAGKPPKKRKQKGKVVRLGASVYARLLVKKRDGESWDSLMRRLLGLANKKGIEQTKRTYWILPQAKLIFDNEKDARGMSVVIAVKAGKKKPESPLKVSEEV